MGSGKVVQVIGPVVDMGLAGEELPGLYNGLEVPVNDDKIAVEVAQHLGNNWVRCVAMGPTDGLRRGAEARDTGGPLTVPVGPQTLGRLFNALGVPLDNLGPAETEKRYPIHRPAPPFEELQTSAPGL